MGGQGEHGPSPCLDLKVPGPHAGGKENRPELQSTPRKHPLPPAKAGQTLPCCPAKSPISALRTTDHLRAHGRVAPGQAGWVRAGYQHRAVARASTGNSSARETLCSGSRPGAAGDGKSRSPLAVWGSRQVQPGEHIPSFASSLRFPRAFPGSPPQLVSMPSTLHRVSNLFSGEIRLGSKGPLSPPHGSPCERPPPPKMQPLSPKFSASGSSATSQPRGGGTS